jgi:HEAT repeat protein
MQAEDCATSLMGALQDEVWQVRAQAAWALGRTRAGIALLVLPARLTDPAWWVRRHAAYALREFGGEGRRELERIAHGSPDPYARDMAREVLEGWPVAA